MKKRILLILAGFLFHTGFSQTTSDSISFSFDSVFSQLKQINFDDLLPEEEMQQLKQELRTIIGESYRYTDSILSTELINDSAMEVFKRDMQYFKQDMQNALNSQEFKEAKDEIIKALEEMLQAFKDEE